MDANSYIISEVRELLGPEVSLLWHDKTKALVMQYPVFRFTIVDWYAWNQYMRGSSYEEYAKHIAVSFTEAIHMKQMTDMLLTTQKSYDKVVVEIKEAEK